MEKSEGAFRTIGEVSGELGVPQHVLRYWETRFPQLRPVQRAGNRRYYRPADVALVRRIHGLLTHEGYTVRGVQKLLAEKALPAEVPVPVPGTEPVAAPIATTPAPSLSELREIRAMLAQALATS